MDFDKAFSSPSKGYSDVLDRLSGRWPWVLTTLGGLASEQLSGAHQPCPACGGSDRYRWLTDDGPGGWYCSHCGGRDRRGGGGSGIDLLMRLRDWTFSQAIRETKAHLDGLPFLPLARSPEKKPVLSFKRTLSELAKFQLLEIAGQVPEGMFYSPAEAQLRGYSKRWSIFKTRRPLLARSAELEFDTEHPDFDFFLK